MKNIEVVVIGDSTNNTLSAVRSFGRAGIRQVLIIKCDEDTCNVSKSKYLRKEDVFFIKSMEEAENILYKIASIAEKPRLMCTFDEAAVFIDNKESSLSEYFLTPARGGHIGKLFNKDEQCSLAQKCGLDTPISINYSRGMDFCDIPIALPFLLKPINSTKGEKSDIHICKSREDFEIALMEESSCNDFILQEFIDKEYELDCIGMRNEEGTIIAGAVRKIRHYPPLIGAGAFGIFIPAEKLGIDLDAIDSFLEEAGYFGPFSIELLHRRGKNYFMEVNFRNEGLAFASTVAGANLHAKYVHANYPIKKIKSIYMMNFSLDYLYVKTGEVGRWQWWKEFLKTRCYINASLKDPMPLLCHYTKKIRRKLHI